MAEMSSTFGSTFRSSGGARGRQGSGISVRETSLVEATADPSATISETVNIRRRFRRGLSGLDMESVEDKFEAMKDLSVRSEVLYGAHSVAHGVCLCPRPVMQCSCSAHPSS